MHSALSLWAGATCIAMEMQGPRHHRYLHAAPMFHLGDLAQAYATTAKAGRHIFVPGFTADGVAKAIREHRVEVTLLVPTMIGMLLDHPSFDPADLASLEVLLFENGRAEEHTSELQSLMRNSYAVFCLQKKKHKYKY